MHFIPDSFGAQGVDLDKYDAARFVIINLLPLSNKQQTDAIRNQVSSARKSAIICPRLKLCMSPAVQLAAPELAMAREEFKHLAKFASTRKEHERNGGDASALMATSSSLPSSSSSSSLAAFSSPSSLVAATRGLFFTKTPPDEQLTWNTSKSNDRLRFENGNRSVTRPGNASSYPLGMAACQLTGGMGFVVTLKAIKSVSNALSFGVVASNGSIPKSGGDGVGAHKGTIGFHIGNVSRSMSSSEPFQVIKMRDVEGSSSMASPMITMFRAGDKLGLSISPDGKTIEFSVNDDNIGRVAFPPGFRGPFTPCCTLPDDCCLDIVPAAELRKARSFRDAKAEAKARAEAVMAAAKVRAAAKAGKAKRKANNQAGENQPPAAMAMLSINPEKRLSALGACARGVALTSAAGDEAAITKRKASGGKDNSPMSLEELADTASTITAIVKQQHNLNNNGSIGRGRYRGWAWLRAGGQRWRR